MIHWRARLLYTNILLSKAFSFCFFAFLFYNLELSINLRNAKFDILLEDATDLMSGAVSKIVETKKGIMEIKKIRLTIVTEPQPKGPHHVGRRWKFLTT